jgi:hypothetical protein
MKIAELLDIPPGMDWRAYTDANFGDSDLLSLHEAVCDLARHAARNPDRYAGLPPAVADFLEQINYNVLSVVEAMVLEDDI